MNEVEQKWRTKLTGGESSSLGPLVFLILLQFPFAGLHCNLLRGNLDPEYLGFLVADAVLSGVLVVLMILYRRIEFGYDENGVYYVGLFRTIRLPWDKVTGIFKETKSRGFSPIDIASRDKWGGSSYQWAYRIESDTVDIRIPEVYSESSEFIRRVCEKSGLQIETKKATAVERFIDSRPNGP